MQMYFTTVVKLKNILFEGLDTSTAKDIALVSVVSFIATIIFSALAAAKDIVAAKRKMNPLARSQQDHDNFSHSVESTGSQNELLSSLRIPTNVGVVRRHKLHLFALESLIHTVKFAYGYMLMLLVMTYSVWLMLGVVLGSGVGYALFQPISAHICSLYSQPPVSKHSCCDKEESQDAVMSAASGGPTSSSAAVNNDTGRKYSPDDPRSVSLTNLGDNIHSSGSMEFELPIVSIKRGRKSLYDIPLTDSVEQDVLHLQY